MNFAVNFFQLSNKLENTKEITFCQNKTIYLANKSGRQQRKGSSSLFPSTAYCCQWHWNCPLDQNFRTPMVLPHHFQRVQNVLKPFALNSVLDLLHETWKQFQGHTGSSQCFSLVQIVVLMSKGSFLNFRHTLAHAYTSTYLFLNPAWVFACQLKNLYLTYLTWSVPSVCE